MDNPISASGGMQGKVVMVTGANAGMGKEISLALARMGATLAMVCRDKERGEAARTEVVAASGNQATCPRRIRSAGWRKISRRRTSAWTSS